MVITYNDSFTIRSSMFTHNRVSLFSGVMETFGETSLTIINSNFTNNSAYYDGVMASYSESSFNIINSTFTNNSAYYDGEVMASYIN